MGQFESCHETVLTFGPMTISVITKTGSFIIFVKATKFGHI